MVKDEDIIGCYKTLIYLEKGTFLDEICMKCKYLERCAKLAKERL